MAGETWYGLVKLFNESGILPISAHAWSNSVIQQIILSPVVAGIAVYNGTLREANQQGTKSNFRVNPEGIALKDAAGQYLKGEMMIAEENSQHDQSSHQVPTEDRPWVEGVEEPRAQDHHGEEDGHFEAAEEHEYADQHVPVALGDSKQARGRHPEGEKDQPVDCRVFQDDARGDRQRGGIS